MKEVTGVIIICFILVLLGVGAFYVETRYADFNFYKSELTIEAQM